MAGTAQKARHPERIEDVFFHKGTEGDVPPSPEIIDADRKIWAPEVFYHINIQKPGNAAGNVNSGGEVSIQLQRIQDQQKQNHCPMNITIVLHSCLNSRIQPVGNDHFFKKAPQHQFKAKFNIVIPDLMRFEQLMCELIEKADGSLNDLRKERKKQCCFQQTVLSLRFGVIYICDICNGLECVK